MRRLPTLLALLLCPAAAEAAPARPPAPAPVAKPAPRPPPRRTLSASAPPAAPVWSLDKPNSRISFKGAVGGEAVDGVIKKWDAQVAFDPANLNASRLILALETGSAVTGRPPIDHVLAGPGWFLSKRYPRAVFVSRSIVQTTAGHYEASGEVRLRGGQRPASFPFTVSVVNNAARIEGALTLDRAAFGSRAAPAQPDPPLVVNVRLSAKKGR